MNKLIGDDKNGLELRYQKNHAGVDVLDEIVLTVDGKTVCHAEKMNEYNMLFIFGIAERFVHVDFELSRVYSETVDIDP